MHIEAIPEIDVTHFKVFLNCDEVLNVATDDAAAVVKFDGTVSVPITVDAHLVVVGFGQDSLPRGLPQFDPTSIPRFVTNPIYVDANGNGEYDPPGGKSCSYTLDPP